ncbi:MULTISPECIES: LysE family transporter [unclassified Avibacterium]|uniref:LysE family transporter n=1 Tax=unclassified Avibacterium TaxID=2685287 RepID=UPI00202646BD|nr:MULTISPECIES: LysE family transporter [unclassified Avibacterium]MCW9715842.1 LysE family transporter [Avibacterium sp. 21-594]MCW9733907.1 LysE family transporter [Avibacterium sp. 20-15]URL03935.1 LysE family transporter [Avibacterium sp. 20-132]
MWTVLFVNLVGLLSPGPDFFYVSRKAASESQRNAIAGAIGIGFGILFWATLVIFGLAIINRTNYLVQYIIMCLGGGYLAYCGIKMLQVTKNAQLATLKPHQEIHHPISREIMKGLLINLSNAKVIVFFSSVMSGFMASISNNTEIMLIILLLALESVLYFILIAFFFSRKIVRDFYNRYNRYIDNFAGIVFLFFGGELIYSGLTTIIELTS